MNTLHIQNISKTYPNGTKALNDVSLTIENGMFGLLGANGAGKSTLMRTIATLQSPSSGSILFNGDDIHSNPDTVRKGLGYLPQEFGVYPKISAVELLHHIGVLKGLLNKKKVVSKLNNFFTKPIYGSTGRNTYIPIQEG
jgi:ABC-type multidrug transport system ATPase subunit